RLGARWVLAHAGGACPHSDHIDRVSGGVVEVAGDPGALVGDGEAALALSLTLGTDRTLLQLGDMRAPEASPLAREPRHGPGQTGVEGLAAWKAAAAERGGTQVGKEQSDDHRRVLSRPGILLIAARREQKERNRRPQCRPDPI